MGPCTDGNGEGLGYLYDIRFVQSEYRRVIKVPSQFLLHPNHIVHNSLMWVFDYRSVTHCSGFINGIQLRVIG